MGTSRRMVEVCRCENCGNEAEMTVVCEMVPLEKEPEAKPPEQADSQASRQEKRSFTCVNCGNEADMIVDI